jgi:hypothetical protein
LRRRNNYAGLKRHSRYFFRHELCVFLPGSLSSSWDARDLPVPPCWLSCASSQRSLERMPSSTYYCVSLEQYRGPFSWLFPDVPNLPQ